MSPAELKHEYIHATTDKQKLQGVSLKTIFHLRKGNQNMLIFSDTVRYTKKARDEGEGRHGNVETKLLDVLLGTGPHTRNCRAYQMPTITG